MGAIAHFDASMLTIDDGNSVRAWFTWQEPDLRVMSGESLREEIPEYATNAPLVLLAVGGGNQEFDYWNDEDSGVVADTICIGQGGHCVIPDPCVARFGYNMFAKAVFRKKPGDIYMGRVEDARFQNSRLPLFQVIRSSTAKKDTAEGSLKEKGVAQ